MFKSVIKLRQVPRKIDGCGSGMRRSTLKFNCFNALNVMNMSYGNGTVYNPDFLKSYLWGIFVEKNGSN